MKLENVADEKHILTVAEAAHHTRIDVFLQTTLTLSRAKTKALFERDAVRLNNRRCKKGDFVAAGDRIEIDFDQNETNAAVADHALTLSILFEDESLVFVDKPAQMPTHPLAPKETGTLANALLAHYPQMAQVGDDPREAGVCHRLDTETSGVLVAAKTRESWLAVREQFKAARELDKRYLAVVAGPLADQGEIDVPLLHAGDHVRPSFEATARPAVSQFEVLQRRGAYALVRVKIVTGVLHQVRAHLAAIGCPILGDLRYGGAPSSRLLLHASSLSLMHPTTGQILTVKSEPDPLFSTLTAG